MDTKLYDNFKGNMFKIKTHKQIQGKPPPETNYWDKIWKKSEFKTVFTNLKVSALHEQGKFLWFWNYLYFELIVLLIYTWFIPSFRKMSDELSLRKPDVKPSSTQAKKRRRNFWWYLKLLIIFYKVSLQIKKTWSLFRNSYSMLILYS